MLNLSLRNWALMVSAGNTPVLQYDNNTVEIHVTGDIPDGWTWELLLAHGEYLDVAHMDAEGETLTVLLTAEQLAFDGYYTVQLRASQPGKIKHTTPVLFAVGDTLSGDEQWPEIPTAFTQALERAEAAITEAEAAIETAQEIESTVIEAAETAEAAAAAATDSAGEAQESQTAAENAQSAAENARDDVTEMVDRMGNVPVVKGNSFAATGTGVTQTLSKVNVKTGAETSETVPMPIANGESAGLMTPEQVEAIEELESRVGGLENQNVRLSYTASGTPTAAEIRAFVLDAGYTDTTKWASIGVVVRETNHIWRYYSNTQEWTDIGLDTVQQASSSVKGIVLGSSTNGKVFVEADGTMSLNGYDALTSGISNLQSEKYEKPGTGIPVSDLTSEVQDKLNAKGIKWATYGTTTAQQVYGWVNTGYGVFADVGAVQNHLIAMCIRAAVSVVPPGVVMYHALFFDGNKYYIVSGNTWSEYTAYNNERTANKVTSLSASSTDEQYPSAKAVYDAIAGKQNTLTFDASPTAGSSNPVTSGGVWDAGNPVLLYTNNKNLNMNTKILEYETVIQYRWLYIVSGSTYVGNRCVVYVPDIKDAGGFNIISWEQDHNYIAASAFTFSEEQGLMFNTNRILGGGNYNQTVNMTNGWGNPRKIYGIK